MERQPLSRHDDHRTQLAQVIERRKEIIEERWVETVRRDLQVSHVNRTDLKNGIGRYLLRLAQELRRTESVKLGGTTAWADVAGEHALTRVRLGFDIAQLAHELILLRRTVTEVLREEGLTPDSKTFELMTELIEAALAASVGSYVQARDYQVRRKQAENLGFLVHQVRSPLMAAALAVAKVKRSGVGDDQERALNQVERNLSRIHRLIDDVLQSESLEAGQGESRTVETTLGAVIDDVVAGARAAADAKGLAFRAAYDSGLALRVDPALVRAALEHLLENGLKYTDAGELSLSIEDRGRELGVHVRDTCPGLSQAELAIIFEPFRRGHSEKTGTGLGLAIARQAVQRLGGRIEVESPGDSGCHFWFTFPKDPPDIRRARRIEA